MMAVNAELGGVGVGDRTSRRVAAINEFNKDRMGKGKRVQMVQRQNRWVQKRIGGTGVNQRPEGDGREAWHEELHQKREMAGSGVGKGKRKGKYTAQPGPY